MLNSDGASKNEYDVRETWEEVLPIGIFPEAHPESCRHALRQYGLACTRLNAELFYEAGQIERNRLKGCTTIELRDIDLWDQLSGMSLWDEPLWKVDDRLLPPEEQLENLNRQARWGHVECFLNRVHEWCLNGAAPEIVPYRNRRGQSTWRFRKLTWTEAGIKPQDSVAASLPASPAEILHAAWNYLFWCRRRWLQAHQGKTWLSESCLHLIREAFRALLEKLAVPKDAWPEIREEAKPTWPHRLETRLAELIDRERRAIERLCRLQISGDLTTEKIRRALDFLDELADEIDLAQRRLDKDVIKLARNNGYDENYWETSLELHQLSPEELLELREEMKQVLTCKDLPCPCEPPSGALILNLPAQTEHIHLNPAA